MTLRPLRLFLLGMALFTLFAIPLHADWVSLSRTASEGEPPQVKVLASDDNQVVLEVSLPGFYRDADKTNLYHVYLPTTATLEGLGKSALPVVSGLIALPGDVTQVHIAHYQTLLTEEFKAVGVYPFQKPTTDEGEEDTFVKDDSHYSSNELYPAQCLSLEKVGVWRNQKVVAFRLVPMQVKPAGGLLLVHTKVSFTLRYEKGRSDVTAVAHLSAFETMYRQTLLNYTPQGMPRAKGKYLVVAEDSLETAIQPLADWRRGQGHEVKVVKLSAVGNTAQKVKEYVTQEYQNGLGYLLLVGDPAKLPLYLWDNQYPGDYWYSCLAGNDLYADIAVGRICANTAAEVDTYVRKVKSYESHNSNGKDWAVKALLVSHKEGSPGKYEGCIEELRKAAYDYKVLFNTRPGSQASNKNETLQSDIREGRGIVAYRGHGSTTTWSGWNGSSFTTSHMATIANDLYPVFYSIACSNSQIDGGTETLAEACLKCPNGGGSAFLGATRPSYTIPNHDFCKLLFVASFQKGVSTTGEVSNYANAELIKKYGASSYAAANVKMYLWLGDPGMKLHVMK